MKQTRLPVPKASVKCASSASLNSLMLLKKLLGLWDESQPAERLPSIKEITSIDPTAG
jgi:hypothetical protein